MLTHTDIQQAMLHLRQGTQTPSGVTRQLRRLMRQGCGDHSCEFRRPTGMGTNGGCQCWHTIEYALWALTVDAATFHASLDASHEPKQETPARSISVRDLADPAWHPPTHDRHTR